MPDSLPPITPAQRQRLQKLWEEARGLMARAGSSPGRKDVEQIHELLTECVAKDPGNTVYLDAFLLNLRLLRSQSKGWWRNFFGRKESVAQGPGRLRHQLDDDAYREQLLLLADHCVAVDAPESEIRYFREALHFSSQNSQVLLRLARSLLRQGRFEETRSIVQTLREVVENSDEVRPLLKILDGTLNSKENESLPAETTS
ncbi:MAG: hypothetical protein K8R36_13300, partial [Planctomycetales bacterium]|nr:hypothetical protein [Planctomycetales bacterium]